jgi:hypothetical protein
LGDSAQAASAQAIHGISLAIYVIEKIVLSASTNAMPGLACRVSTPEHWRPIRHCDRDVAAGLAGTSPAMTNGG